MLRDMTPPGMVRDVIYEDEEVVLTHDLRYAQEHTHTIYAEAGMRKERVECDP